MNKHVPYHIVSVVTVTSVLASVFYYFVCLGLRHAKQDAVGKYNYITNDTTYYNTVFFGSSTTRLGINVLLFDSITGSYAFNAGMDGIRIVELNLLVKKYVSSHRTPKNIFISFDAQTLDMKMGVWYFPQYYPFISDPDLKELTLLEPKLFLGKYAPPLAVTYIDDPLKNLAFIGLLNDYHTKDYSVPLKGFHPAYVSGMKDSLPIKPIYFTGSKKGWELLDQTLDFCAERNIHVDFVLPPSYNYTLSDSSVKFISRLKAYETKYNTSVFNFIENNHFVSKELFPNRTHVNARGAELFTTSLANEFVAQHPGFYSSDTFVAQRYE